MKLTVFLLGRLPYKNKLNKKQNLEHENQKLKTQPRKPNQGLRTRIPSGPRREKHITVRVRRNKGKHGA